MRWITRTVKARNVANWIEVSVTDTGPGIPVDNMDKLFEPLFTTKQGGVGFGLALVKTIIERHGGKVEAESEPGKGARFTMLLPVSPEGERQQQS